MNQIGNPLHQPIITGRPDSRIQSPANTPQTNANLGSFGELLKQKLQERAAQPLTFSKHAQTRTIQRGIEISPEDLERLTEAVGQAEDKGLKDTLVLMNNNAFIVNVPNRVVVTVVDGSDSENNVFTNIDGAVVL